MRRILLIGVLTTSWLLLPLIARAEDSTPPDAPYQETAEEPQSPPPETPEEVVTEPEAATLPTVHTSPLSVVEPTTQPAAQEPEETLKLAPEPKPVVVLVPNLLRTLTLRSIQSSRVWSRFNYR